MNMTKQMKLATATHTEKMWRKLWLFLYGGATSRDPPGPLPGAMERWGRFCSALAAAGAWGEEPLLCPGCIIAIAIVMITRYSQ